MNPKGWDREEECSRQREQPGQRTQGKEEHVQGIEETVASVAERLWTSGESSMGRLVMQSEPR